MSESMFQKEFNDQILVRDIDILNPAMDMLDETFPTTDTKCFVAKPMHILKMIYTDHNSLSAFSKDELSTYYVLHHKDHKAERIFLSHTEGQSETLVICSFESMDAEAQTYTPAIYR